MNLNITTLPFIKAQIEEFEKKITEQTGAQVKVIILSHRKNHNDVIKIIAEYLQVDISAIIGKRRNGDVVLARHMVCYVLHKFLGYKLVDIAKLLKKKDHTTISNAVQRTQDMLDTEYYPTIDLFNHIKTQIL